MLAKILSSLVFFTLLIWSSGRVAAQLDPASQLLLLKRGQRGDPLQSDRYRVKEAKESTAMNSEEAVKRSGPKREGPTKDQAEEENQEVATQTEGSAAKREKVKGSASNESSVSKTTEKESKTKANSQPFE
jgi:hypothetical protein